MLYQLLIRTLLKINKRKFINAIARLEFGVSAFCTKQAEIAKSEGKLGLAQQLEIHGEEEQRHGLMLNSLIDGKDKIFKDAKNGAFISMELDDGIIIREKVGNSFKDSVKVLEWDSVNYPGHRIKAIYENFDGMSDRYWSLKIFFQGRKASNFHWDDKLSFMHVLECETRKFYQELYKVVGDCPLGAIAAKIASEEEDHAAYLERSMTEFYITSVPTYFIDKWRNRLKLSLMGLMIDIMRIL